MFEKGKYGAVTHYFLFCCSETVLSITVAVYMHSLHDVDKSEEERLSNNESTNTLGGKGVCGRLEKNKNIEHRGTSY